MADENLSKNGVYFDTKNSKVVESPPEEGVQLVAPGGEITPAVQDDIDRYRDIENGVERPVETVRTRRVKGEKATAPDAAEKATT